MRARFKQGGRLRFSRSQKTGQKAISRAPRRMIRSREDEAVVVKSSPLHTGDIMEATAHNEGANVTHIEVLSSVLSLNC